MWAGAIFVLVGFSTVFCASAVRKNTAQETLLLHLGPKIV